MDLTPEEITRAQAWVNRLHAAALEAELSLVSATIIPGGEHAAVLVWTLRNGHRVTLAPLAMIPPQMPVLETDGSINDAGIEALGHILTILRRINDYRPAIGRNPDGRTSLVIAASGGERRVLLILPWDENPMKCWMAPGVASGETRH